MSPDPGEPGMRPAVPESTARAGVVPGWPGGPDVVHLVVKLGHTMWRWATRCPADVEGLSAAAGDHPRAVVLVLDQITCPACLQADADLAAGVDMVTRAQVGRRDQVAADVLSFLRFAREELDLVLADYAGGARLKAYPSHADVEFVRKWLAQRPVTD